MFHLNTSFQYLYNIMLLNKLKASNNSKIFWFIIIRSIIFLVRYKILINLKFEKKLLNFLIIQKII